MSMISCDGGWINNQTKNTKDKSIMEKQTKEQKIMNKVSKRFNLELDEEVALMLIRETRNQAISDVIEELDKFLLERTYNWSSDDLNGNGTINQIIRFFPFEWEDFKAEIEKTAQEMK